MSYSRAEVPSRLSADTLSLAVSQVVDGAVLRLCHILSSSWAPPRAAPNTESRVSENILEDTVLRRSAQLPVQVAYISLHKGRNQRFTCSSESPVEAA